ncbi:hypothetical protein DM2_650 [Halorubrum sp. DM2]|uniref:hypothetical protein n=1 Tax=unclassified Halorubrum TaxID=2642239 RepID=UPI00064F9107|nr:MULTISPECIES: hypothetical protein [unclassified Halorubrum]VTT87316.1 hypothetical protein DM2_650 [Halorubrum sp. DM2]
MVTRRQTIIGLASAAVGGGAAASAGTFTSSVSAGADMRVVVVSDLRLEPANDDGPYVTTEDGEVVIAVERLNRHALTEFGDLVRVVNDGNIGYDELRFEFDAGDGDEADEVAAALGITADGDLDEENGTFTLTPDGGLGPGDGVGFGISVDLLPSSESGISDFPESAAELQLFITAAHEGDE